MTVPLEVRTLGPYRLLLAGQPITTLTSRTAEALLVYLMRHTRPLAREVIADFLWDERDSQRAAANLRTILTMLRKSLGDYLIITRRTVAFNHAADYWWDLAELEKNMAALDPMLANPQPLDLDAMGQLDATLALVQGDFLEGFHLSESSGFEEWLRQTQNQVRRLAEEGLQRLVEACLHHGEYRAGVEHADRLLLLDPYNEEAHRHMMWLLVRSGRRNAALAHYEACRQVIEDELGVGPDEVTNQVYHRIRALPAAPPRRLPPEPTPFVGRSGEVETIAGRLAQPHCRLLTLLGSGGMGKTRLAIQAAGWLSLQRPGQFLDGVFFVSLANIGSADSAPVAIADALGLPISGSMSPADLVQQHLRTREALLVLDSVEHLAIQDAFLDWLIELLNRAPHIKLLATSRVRLNLHEEWVYDVAGLDYPQDDPESDVASGEPANGQAPRSIASYAAGQLFMQHAARLQRTFVPDPADEQAIARICRLLDGQPLGLELAAAWTRAHTCTEIVERIAQDMDFLDTSVRNVPARQRSLRAVFDYSWSLLSEAEQTAMQRLAVFVGPIDAETAEVVAQVSAAQLSTLVDKSLLRKAPAVPAAESRQDGDPVLLATHDVAVHDVTVHDFAVQEFAMHDSVRQYALEKLAAVPALDRESWWAYCRHYATYLQEVEPQLHTAAQLDVQAEIHGERPNIRAAWDVAVARGWWTLVDTMLDGYYWYLWRRSEMQVAHNLLRVVVDAARTAIENVGKLGAGAVDRLRHEQIPPEHTSPPEPLHLARLQSRLADALWWVGDYESSRELAAVAEESLRSLRAWKDLAWIRDTVGQLEYSAGNYGAARDIYEESLRLFRQEEVAEGVAHTLCALANVLCDGDGAYERAQSLYAESLAEYQHLGDLYGQAKVTINLGALNHSLGHHAQAVPYYEEGMALCRALDHRQTLAIVLNNMGQAQKVLGNVEEATPLLEESVELRRELGDLRGLALTLMSLANVTGHEENFDLAYRYCADALQIGLQMGAPALLADLLVSVADLFAHQGQIVYAARIVHAVLQDPVEGSALRRNAQEVLTRLEADDKAAADQGKEEAANQDMYAAANQTLAWLKSPRKAAAQD